MGKILIFDQTKRRLFKKGLFLEKKSERPDRKIKRYEGISGRYLDLEDDTTSIQPFIQK